MKKLIVVPIILVLILSFLKTGILYAQVGVGILPGKIEIDQALVPGGDYNLPPIQVVNTGNQAADYEVTLARMEKQEELQPPVEFFTFSPATFRLQPGANQVVSVGLQVPVNAEPGKYLAYIEAHPVSQSPGTGVGVAAASKVFFTVSQSGTLQGLYYTAVFFLKRQAPLSFIIPGVILLGLVVFILSRNLKVEFKLSRK